jgi:hypothetical protein
VQLIYVRACLSDLQVREESSRAPLPEGVTRQQNAELEALRAEVKTLRAAALASSNAPPDSDAADAAATANAVVLQLKEELRIARANQQGSVALREQLQASEDALRAEKAAHRTSAAKFKNALSELKRQLDIVMEAVGGEGGKKI